MEKKYTAKEVAAILRISPRTAIRLCESGQFPGAYKTGTGKTSHWRIPESGLNAYLNKMKK